MNIKKAMLFSVPLGLVLLLLGLFGSATPVGAGHGGSASGNGIAPVVVAGNPKCTDLGYAFGLKPQPEPPPDGTYFFGGPVTFPPHALTAESVTITNQPGDAFDWTSTIGIDAVIVKGGPNANLYVYDPPAEEISDSSLHSPINHNNNQPFAISHIEFCYDWEVDVEKTADAEFTRTFEWDIDKSVTPDTWDLFTGDSGTSKYTVTVDKTGFTDSDWAVSGEIWVENNTPLPATVTSVSDVVSGPIAPTVVCPPLPAVLAPGDSLHCTYSTPLPDGSNRVNTATVGTTGQVGGGQATANVTFGAPTTLVNDSINVDDSYAGDLGTFNDDGSAMYERTFTCDDDEGTHDNTATIVETGQSDGASVTVNCYALAVEKDAATSLTRTWTWTIDKTADQTDLTLSPGQQFLVTYWVELTPSSTDSDWAVSGEIWISNPNPSQAASLTGVADVASPNIAATVNCPSLTVPASGSLHCTYSASLPDAANRTNTATATLQNHDFDSQGTGTPSGTTDFSGQAAVDFTNATVTEIDEEVAVSDSLQGDLGTAFASDGITSFHYQRFVGPFSDPEDCGDQSVPNTADFVTNDTGATGEDDWTVNVFVPCAQGCTLTPGYWKTHNDSFHGGAPPDNTWDQLPSAELTTFYLSNQTYFDVLWTAPKGNAYYILARQYIAAQLNFLNGADPSAAQTAFNAATTLFNTYTPSQIAALKGNNPLRKQFINLATTLDNYNNGLIGPGHCDEDDTGAP